MKKVAIIPARMASSRFPGKPMELIHGMPMIGHCFHRVSMCDQVDETYVATCDLEIADYIKSLGGAAIMTSDKHQRASDRAAEAMLKVEQATGEKTDILIMVQGDEPMDTPSMISDALTPMLSDPDINVVNLMGEITSVGEFEDPNTVKVVTDLTGNALYFSREAIPSRRKGIDAVPMHKQICIIPFRRDYLLKYNALEETPLEIIESVDMMRILENGESVRMVKTKEPSYGVDTQEDLILVEKEMTRDLLMPRYLGRNHD